MSEDINPLAPAEDAAQEEAPLEPQITSNPSDYSVETVSVEGEGILALKVTPEPVSQGLSFSVMPDGVTTGDAVPGAAEVDEADTEAVVAAAEVIAPSEPESARAVDQRHPDPSKGGLPL